MHERIAFIFLKSTSRFGTSSRCIGIRLLKSSAKILMALLMRILGTVVHLIWRALLQGSFRKLPSRIVWNDLRNSKYQNNWHNAKLIIGFIDWLCAIRSTSGLSDYTDRCSPWRSVPHLSHLVLHQWWLLVLNWGLLSGFLYCILSHIMICLVLVSYDVWMQLIFFVTL